MAHIDYVLQYAARGWACFPLRPRSKLPLISAKAGGRGFHDATTDPVQLEAWWAREPLANIGIATGASGLVVLDADGLEGLAQLQTLAAPHGGLPKTLVQKTGRDGGLHFIYRGTVKSSQVKGEHLDVRGSTGYIVAAPSVHPSRALYQWVDATVPIADLPAWLREWANSRKGAPQAAPAPTGQAPIARVGRGLAARSVANLTEAPKFTLQEASRLRSALAMLDAATDYLTWISYGAALHDLKWIINDVDHGFLIWDEWSSTSQGLEGRHSYPGRAELEKKWASFDREYNGVRTTVASIFKAAFEQGWQYQEKQQNTNHSEGLNGFAHNFSNQPGFTPPIIWPDRDQWNRPKPTCRNARAAIRHMGLTCEHDRFHDKLIIGGQPIAEWAGEVTDNTVHMLRVTLARQYNLDPGTGNVFDAAVQECLQGGFDPVADYLDALQWDGTPRLRTWLSVYMGAQATSLNAAMGGLMLIAAVRRVRQPGCKFDQILVLISDEGKNKSSAIEILAGEGNFSDQTILTADDRGQQEALSGVWLYEIADLAGMSKADTEKVKAFASRRVDRARPAYARARVDKPRRCVFFATTNHSTFLKSQTGNRRFWPVEVGRIDLGALARDRDQLWAEAAMIENRGGQSLFLPEILWGEAGEAQRERMDIDPWEDDLALLIGKTKDAKGRVYATADGRYSEARILSQNLIRNTLGLGSEKISDVTGKRVAAIMRRLGWDGPKTIREGEIVGRGYTKRGEPM
jgi:hypothetical protein